MLAEYRHYPDTELRFENPETSAAKIRGYAVVFNSPIDLGKFREVIRPGSCRNAISKGQEIKCLVDHKLDKILGTTRNGSCVVREDARGLYFETDIPEVSYARDTVELLKRNLMKGASFGFYPESSKRVTPVRREGNQPIIEWTDLDIFDVSVVYEPAYPTTSAFVRSLEQECDMGLLTVSQADRLIRLAENFL